MQPVRTPLPKLDGGWLQPEVNDGAGRDAEANLSEGMPDIGALFQIAMRKRGRHMNEPLRIVWKDDSVERIEFVMVMAPLDPTFKTTGYEKIKVFHPLFYSHVEAAGQGIELEDLDSSNHAFNEPETAECA